MSTARAKYQITAPAGFSASLPENPRKDYTKPDARPPGRSGGGPPVSTPHRVSSSRRGGTPTRRKTAKKASRRRG